MRPRKGPLRSTTGCSPWTSSWVRFAPLTTSGLVIALGALAAGSQFLDRVLNSLLESSDISGRLQELPLPLTIVLAVVAALVMISLLSILGYLIANWGFTLSRDSAGRTFHVRRGLFTSRETSIDRERLRGLEVHEPLGLRLAKGGRLSAIATGLSRSESSAAIVPPAPRKVVIDVGEDVLGETGPFRVELVQHGPRARRRRYTRALLGGIVPVAITGVACAVLDLPWWVVPLVAVPVLAGALALARDRYRRLGHALTEDYLVVRSGTFSGRRDALQRTGIIGWNIEQTFFQRRAGLATLSATTAAGRQGYCAIDIPEHGRDRPRRRGRAGAADGLQISFLSTGIGACRITGASALHGSGGTIAESFSFSIADTIAFTPSFVDAISGVLLADWPLISDSM